MADKVYQLHSVVTTPTKDGKGVVRLSRDNIGHLTELVPAARIQELLDAGIVTVSNADGSSVEKNTSAPVVEGVTAAPAPAARKGKE